MDPDRFLPLKPRTLSMLTELAQEPLHGYALMTRLRERRGTESLGPATLYRSLDELEDKSLIQARAVKEAPKRGATWELTALGRRVLAAELARLEAVTELARAALEAGR